MIGWYLRSYIILQNKFAFDNEHTVMGSVVSSCGLKFTEHATNNTNLRMHLCDGRCNIRVPSLITSIVGIIFDIG